MAGYVVLVFALTVWALVGCAVWEVFVRKKSGDVLLLVLSVLAGPFAFFCSFLPPEQVRIWLQKTGVLLIYLVIGPPILVFLMLRSLFRLLQALDNYCAEQRVWSAAELQKQKGTNVHAAVQPVRAQARTQEIPPEVLQQLIYQKKMLDRMNLLLIGLGVHWWAHRD